MCMYIYIYIYTYIHTYIHTYVYMYAYMIRLGWHYLSNASCPTQVFFKSDKYYIWQCMVVLYTTKHTQDNDTCIKPRAA